MPLRAGDGQLPQKLRAFTSLCRKNHSGGRNIMRSLETKPASPGFLTRHPQRVDGSFFTGVQGCFLLIFYLPFNCHVSRPCSCVCFISSSPAVPAGRAAAIKLRTHVFAEAGPLWDGKPEPASLLPERSPPFPVRPPNPTHLAVRPLWGYPRSPFAPLEMVWINVCRSPKSKESFERGLLKISKCSNPYQAAKKKIREGKKVRARCGKGLV